MAVLEPKLAILDETDSGLDIDALKIVANGVNAMRSPERAIVVVTHYQRLLDYIVPDFVHVLSDGRIVKSGDRALALELEDKGYGWLEPELRAAAAPGREGVGTRDGSRRSSHSPQTEAYLADFDRLAAGRVRREPAWLRGSAPAGHRAVRRRRLSDDARRGVEVHQRRADRRPVVRAGARWPERAGARISVERWAGAFAGYRLVLVNGAHAPQLSGGELPAGVHVSSLRSVLATNPAAVEPYLGRFAAAGSPGVHGAEHAALFEDGAFVWIPPGTIVERPISLLFVSASPGTASVSHPRVLIVAGDSSQCRIVESYVGSPGQEYFTNAVTEVVARVRRGGRSLQTAAREPAAPATSAACSSTARATAPCRRTRSRSAARWSATTSSRCSTARAATAR